MIALHENTAPAAIIDDLQNADLRGELRLQEAMARHTTWRAGGSVDYYYAPADLADLSNFLMVLRGMLPVLIVGRGSNLLIRDGGYRGVLIVTAGLNNLQWQEGGKLFVAAGVPSPQVASFCADAGFAGVEFLAGIPGSIGGALAMNAGAFGHEIWDFVHSATMINNRGQIQIYERAHFEVSYRQVRRAPDSWFIGCSLSLAADEPAQIQAKIRNMMHVRTTTQPIGKASCGSVFRNPPGDYAARLIDACGLKGHRIGGALVSMKHANFIVNDGGATATDIEALINDIQAQVQARYAIRLVPEAQIIGEPTQDG